MIKLRGDPQERTEKGKDALRDREQGEEELTRCKENVKSEWWIALAYEEKEGSEGDGETPKPSRSPLETNGGL